MVLIGDGRGAAPLALDGSQLSILLVSAVIGIALGHVFYYIAIKRLGVTAAAGVLQLQPVCVTIASYFLFGEWLTAAQWTAGALAIGGALLILVFQQRTAG